MENKSQIYDYEEEFLKQWHLCAHPVVSRRMAIYPFTLSSIYYTFFSGKPSNVSSDLAPPVQL